MTIDEIKTIGVVVLDRWDVESHKCLLGQDGMSFWWT